MNEQALRAHANRFFDAIENGDIEAFADCYHADGFITFNFESTKRTKEQNVASIQAMLKRTKSRKYTERQLDILPDGWVQRHVVVAERADGSTVKVPACIFCRVKDGRALELREYADSAHVAEIRKETV